MGGPTANRQNAFTLGTAASEGQAELLGLISTMAAGVMAELTPG